MKSFKLFKSSTKLSALVSSAVFLVGSLTGLASLSLQKTTVNAATAPSVYYRTQVENIGWQPYVTNGQLAGTTGRALREEAIRIKLSTPSNLSGSIYYRTQVENVGWQGWMRDDQLSGTVGRALRLETLQIKLTGQLATQYDVYYQSQIENIGWQDWKKNGETSGTVGRALRLEGIKILLVKKGARAPQNPVSKPAANTNTQPVKQQPAVNTNLTRRVYITGGGTSDVYWYSTQAMPKSTNLSKVISMTEGEAIAKGKRHSLKE